MRLFKRIIRSLTQGGFLTSFNNILYLFKRNAWMLDPRLYAGVYNNTPIKSPIFLLGVQGGGVTLLSRMLRRSSQVVSATGNHTYWAGADEMNSVFGPYLPESLKSIEYLDSVPPEIIQTSDWMCGIDACFPLVRKKAGDADSVSQKKLLNTIRYCLGRYGVDREHARFVDKSQSWSLKLSFIEALLKDHAPRFVLVTRNPYAICVRVAEGNFFTDDRIKRSYNVQQRLELAASSWCRYMDSVLSDKPDIVMVKFEDILNDPEKHLQRVCTAVDLPFEQDMLPAAHHQLPRGIKREERWYPLKTDVNSKYLDKITPEQVAIVNRVCGSLIEKTGYRKL